MLLSVRQRNQNMTIRALSSIHIGVGLHRHHSHCLGSPSPITNTVNGSQPVQGMAPIARDQPTRGWLLSRTPINVGDSFCHAQPINVGDGFRRA